MDETDNQITESEIDAAVASALSENDIRERLQALEDAQTRWERLAHLETPKVACVECGGAGAIGGEICVGCMGKRVVDAPDAEPFEAPDFAAIRRQITDYAAALDDRALPDGHRIKKNLALPPAASVPDLASIKALDDQARARMSQLRQLGAGDSPRGVDMRQLPQPKRQTGMMGEGDLGDVEDAELDDLEDAAEAKNPHRRGRR